MPTTEQDTLLTLMGDTEPDASDVFMPPQREAYVYRCTKHSYVLESRSPRMAASLRVFCPLCKDEFFAQHLTELQNENPNAGNPITDGTMTEPTTAATSTSA